MIEGPQGDYIHNVAISSPGPQGISLFNPLLGAGTANTCINKNIFTGFGTTISSSSGSSNIGSGNTPNNGNLTVGTCNGGI
jgi:hypothetical protein